jgi:hypothetical protein
MPLIDPNQCACPVSDPYECYMCRYGHMKPLPLDEDPVCECACHRRDPDDYWDEIDDC